MEPNILIKNMYYYVGKCPCYTDLSTKLNYSNLKHNPKYPGSVIIKSNRFDINYNIDTFHINTEISVLIFFIIIKLSLTNTGPHNNINYLILLPDWLYNFIQ